MATDNQLKTASVLSFERKLDPSDALLFSGNWDNRDNADNWPGVTLRTKSVRGTVANRRKTSDQDATRLDADIESPNLQTVDVAALPPDADTVKAQFTLKILGGAGIPAACNNAAYQAKLAEVMHQYTSEHGFSTLAYRYAHNLANGRFLWRNRLGAENIAIQIRRLVEGQPTQTWQFDALKLPLRDITDAGANDADLRNLANVIEEGLAGQSLVLLEITAFARLGAGQEVFPSQELILQSGRQDKSKTLYSVNGIAGIHSQKLGNAIRTIDTWYPDAASQGMGPIAIEPYGAVTNRGMAYRQPNRKADFYNLLDNWLLKDQKPNPENQHFVMATLIRGGVFGGKEA